MEDLKQIITKEEIDNFKSFSGKTWDRKNQSHVECEDNSKSMLAKLKTAVTDAASKIWNVSDIKTIDLTKTLTQPKPKKGERGGGMPAFPNYLAVRVGIASEYEAIVRYWIFFTNSGSWGDISCIVRRQTGTGKRENGQIVRCNAAWGG